MLGEMFDLTLDYIFSKKGVRFSAVRFFIATIILVLAAVLLSGLFSNLSPFVKSIAKVLPIVLWALSGIYYFVRSVRGGRKLDAVCVVLLALLTVGVFYVIGGAA